MVRLNCATIKVMNAEYAAHVSAGFVCGRGSTGILRDNSAHDKIAVLSVALTPETSAFKSTRTFADRPAGSYTNVRCCPITTSKFPIRRSNRSARKSSPARSSCKQTASPSTPAATYTVSAGSPTSSAKNCMATILSTTAIAISITQTSALYHANSVAFTANAAKRALTRCHSSR